MAIKYKTTTLNGKPILSHRKVWIMHNGDIPHGYHIHHINGDRFDNRIENLKLLSAKEHISKHSKGKAAWNKGIKYGETNAYKKSNKVRKINHIKKAINILKIYESENITQKQLSERFGVCQRTINENIRKAREFRQTTNKNTCLY